MTAFWDWLGGLPLQRQLAELRTVVHNEVQEHTLNTRYAPRKAAGDCTKCKTDCPREHYPKCRWPN